MSIVPSPQLAKLIDTNEKLLSYSQVTVDPGSDALLADWYRSALGVTELVETNSPTDYLNSHKSRQGIDASKGR
jgi:hypothetical protein